MAVIELRHDIPRTPGLGYATGWHNAGGSAGSDGAAFAIEDQPRSTRDAIAGVVAHRPAV